MTLYKMLRERAEQENPVRVRLTGAGNFGAMYFAQRTAHFSTTRSHPPDRANSDAWNSGA